MIIENIWKQVVEVYTHPRQSSRGCGFPLLSRGGELAFFCTAERVDLTSLCYFDFYQWRINIWDGLLLVLSLSQMHRKGHIFTSCTWTDYGASMVNFPGLVLLHRPLPFFCNNRTFFDLCFPWVRLLQRVFDFLCIMMGKS